MARRTYLQIVAEIQRMPGMGRISRGEIIDKMQTATKDLLNSPWPFNYAETNVLIPAPYSVGTVSIPDGSTVVTGALAAWDPTWTGRRIQFGGANMDYIVSAVTGAHTLTLAQPINIGTSLVNSSYVLYKDTFTYPADYIFGSDVALLHPTVRFRINKIPRYKFEQIMNAGYRSFFTTIQQFYCDHGQDGTGLFQFRIGPPPSGVAEYRLCYHKMTPSLNLLTDVVPFPDGFDEIITLTTAAKLYDLYKMPQESESVKALAAGKIKLLKRQAGTQTIDDVPEASFELPDSSISQWGLSIARMP